MKNQSLTIEHAVYFGVLFLAIVVRLIAPESPLSDFEASWAMRAWDVAQGTPTEIGAQPGYVLLTGLLFFLFGSGDQLARLLPIIAGSLLVLLPFFFRDRLGRKAALVMAIGLAIDPGLVALSRLAGGPMMAVGFGLLGLAAFSASQTVLGGILVGLAVLSGPPFWAGLLGLGLAWGILRAFRIFPRGERRNPSKWLPDLPGSGSATLRAGFISGGGTLLLAGTLFLRFPQGLGAMATALPAYVQGWLIPSGVPASRLWLALMMYQPLALVFGLISMGRAWAGRPSDTTALRRALGVWFLAALLLALVYPGRQVAELAWPLVPLWGLAALEIARYLKWEAGQSYENTVSWALAALLVVLFSALWVNVAGLSVVQPGDRVYVLRWVVIGGAIMLGVLSTLLVATAWPPQVATRGAVLGVCLALGVGMLSGIWGGSSRDTSRRMDVWTPGAMTGQQDLLMRTLGDLGEWSAGRRDSLDVVVLVDYPSLRWSLRQLPYVRFQETVSPGDLPSAIVTTAEQTALKAAFSYRGQDFTWRVSPAWDAITAGDWLTWLVVRQVPTVSEQIIVWARADLFPGGGSSEAQAESPVAEGETQFIPEEEIESELPLR